MDVIFTERAYTNSPHLFIETVWPYATPFTKRERGPPNMAVGGG